MEQTKTDYVPSPETPHRLLRRAMQLSVFTVAYNILEGVISIAVGIRAGSIALAGFGLDSAVESLSGLIMIWRFSSPLSSERAERREAAAVKLVGWSFFLFGLYVLYESVTRLAFRERPEPILIGIIVAAVSTIAMPVLYKLKLDTGRAIGSRALIADSKETLACFFLSVSLLTGLGLNYLGGIWWADPAVGLVVAGFLFREGYEVLEGEDDGGD